MESAQLKDMISGFSGNIQSSYSFLKKVHDKLNFSLGLDFSSSNSLIRYTNMVRNFIGRELIEKPLKSGRNLILNERTLLQLLVARKYLGSGCSMDSLSGYLIEMPLDALYERLFAPQIPDIETLTTRVMAQKSACAYKEPETTNSSKLVRTERRKRLFEHVPISADFYLVVRDGLFSEDELEEMKGLLAKFKKSKNKS